MRRYFDTFLRYWYIAILPILVLPACAYVLTATPPTAYGSANIWVDQTALQQLSYVNGNLAPADNMATFLNQLLLSPSFDAGVAKRSPLYVQQLLRTQANARANLTPRQIIASDLSKNAYATAIGPNIVSVAYTTRNGAIAAQVVQSVLGEAAYEISQLNRQQVGKDIARYKHQLKKTRSTYSSAANKLGTYMAIHKIVSNDLALLQLSDPNLASLYQAVQTSQGDLANVQQQLSRLQAQYSAQTVLRIIDPPSMQVAVVSKKKRLTALAIPLILAFLAGGAFIVLKTARDRSLRNAEDVVDLLGLPVLAVVPLSSALASQTRGPRRALTGNAQVSE